MPRIPIFKIGTPAELPAPRPKSYTPSVSLNGLQLGIDNLRHDVWLSPTFTKAAGAHISRLIARYGKLESVLAAESTATMSPARNIFSKVMAAGANKVPEL